MNNSNSSALGSTVLTDWRIVTKKNASVLETMLARHISLYFKNTRNTPLPISDDTTETANEILVGSTTRTTLAPEKNGFAVSFTGGKLQLVMDGLRGFEGLLEYLESCLLCSQISDGFSYAAKPKNELDDGTRLIDSRLGDIRVMFYNVYGWSGYGPSNVRHAMQTEIVKEYAPDVLCLQEYGQMPPHVCYHECFTPLMQANGYTDASVPTDYVNNTPLFYRRDKLSLIKSGCFLYSKPNNANSKSITWAVLRVKATGKSFIAISTHMMYDQPAIDANAARVQNAHEMLNVISDIRSLDHAFADIPLIMGGDMNCNESSEPQKIFTAAGLIRAFRVAEEKNDNCCLHPYPTWSDDDGTFVRWVCVEGTNENAIDHVYVSENVTVKTYASVTSTVPLWCSDHMPLIVEINI